LEQNLMNVTTLSNQLVNDEGIRLKTYRDTVGKLTIGVGRNLDDVGISTAEAMALLANDLAHVASQLDAALPWWKSMTDDRQQALANMCFNMGLGTLLTFKTTLGLMQSGNYSAAADAMLNSKWAKQVGARAVRIANQVKGG
jgi:lysozyme